MKFPNKKNIILLSIFLLAKLNFFSETITLPINSEETGFDTPVELPFEWNEKWFGGNSPSVYNHGLAKIACALSEVSYVNLKTDPNLNQLKNVYKKLGVAEQNMEFHYQLDYKAPGLEKDQAAFSIAAKEINSAKGKRTLIFLTIRGTPYSAPEWISNVNVADSTHESTLIHEGFFRTQTLIQKALIYYLLKRKIDPDTTYFLITGHSRGAALSNLLGAQLADQGYFDTENIYVYTFAAPNVSQQEKVSDPKYNFIWNIINPEDIVPTVPLKTSGKKKEWNYGKFGQSKVFANYWNTDPEIYTDEYIPGVNKYFSQIMRRDYYPFKTGTYIPSLVTRILSDLYHNVNEFYDAPISLRNQAEKIFYKIYPEETELENTEAGETEKEENQKEQKKDRGLFATIGKSINKSTGGFLDYSEFAFFDMHCCSNYLSWLLALDENKAFSDKKSSRLIINGAYECAVFDSQENMVLKIVDGIPKLKSIKIPILAVPFPYGTVIGFPSNQNYSVVIYKDSILPTPIPLKIEHYDEEGYVTEFCPKKYVYPHKGIAYTFTAGEKTLEQEKITAVKNNSKTTKMLVKAGKLKQQDVFRVLPEVSVDTDGLFEGGIRIGSRRIHGAVLTGQSLCDLGKSINLNFGIGHEETLISRTLLDFSINGKFLWAFSDIENGDHRFNFVPEARISLEFKPLRRFSVFISGVFDFHIENFNDTAFHNEVRDNNFGTISFSDSVDLHPSIRFGLRF